MNKTIAVAAGLALALLASRSDAQKPAPETHDLQHEVTSTQTTPEMWLYEQERNRYEDPRAAVRRKAELRAAQRGDRLAAMKWFGQSNARPVVSTTPYCYTYGAGWVSNTPNPYQWQSGPRPSVVVRPGGSVY